MATDLYRRTITYDYGDDDRRELMEMVWSPTPWMANVYTGRIGNDGRYRDMAQWCRERHGRECSPIHEHEGEWQRGSATIDGWTWFGFRTKKQMDEFLSKWGDTPNTLPLSRNA